MACDKSATARAPRAATPIWLTATVVTIAAIPLTGCVSLMAKTPVQTEAASAAEPMETADNAALPGDGEPQKKQARASLYVDPMVASANSSHQRPPENAKSRAPLAQQPTEMAAESPPQPENVGELVMQPTSVQAGSNSIYALANAQVAAAEGVPSYAPVRNINPIAGSVFSARPSPVGLPPSTQAGTPSDGLW